MVGESRGGREGGGEGGREREREGGTTARNRELVKTDAQTRHSDNDYSINTHTTSRTRTHQPPHTQWSKYSRERTHGRDRKSEKLRGKIKTPVDGER